MIDNHKHNSDANVSNASVTEEEEELLKSTSNKDNNIIDPKDDKIIQLEIKLAQIQENKRDSILRLNAEIENIRRRSAQEIEKTHKFALERFILELLPVIDNLERTINIISNSNNSLSVIKEGVDLTLKLFLATIQKFGVESICAVNVAFNPDIHQAISMEESKEYGDNQVLTIIQKGYMLNKRLIRPAMVIVSKSKC